VRCRFRAMSLTCHAFSLIFFNLQKVAFEAKIDQC